ncbi:MAG: C1 family peptidase [Hyphomonadaceae bacterium]|nr:C1 family peptidase [Hyphomonadaceae bacterium]
MRGPRTAILGLSISLAFAGTALSEEVASPELGTGLIPLSDEEYEALEERDPLLRGALPEYVDLSSFFPVPGHQGAQGSCVGWAVGYALKTYQEAKEMRLVRPDEYYHFSPAFVFNSIKEGDSCTAGSRISDALEFVQTTGAVSMNDFPYLEDECPAPPEELLSRGEEFQIKSFNRLERGSLFAIQEALSNEKPVVAGMYVYPSFQTWQGGGDYAPDPDNERIKDYHAVTIVGYDDEREAIKIINSWGTAWGDNGYVWMDYDAAEDLIREAYVTTDVLIGDFDTEDPGMVFASNPIESSESVAASGAPETVEPEIIPLTEAILAAAVTGHVGRDSEGRTPGGYDYYPASVWLSLEEPMLSQIESVEYYFYHPTFFNPKRPVADSNVFLATWKGYGCIENAEVKVVLKTGEELSAPFNLCTIWDRFHPGAFRKDGTRSGSQPLSEEESFLKTANGQQNQKPEKWVPPANDPK